MKLMEYQNNVADLRHALGSARAVCNAFGNEYVDSLDKHAIAASIEAAPEEYEYLFNALVDELHAAYQLAARIADVKIEQ